MRAEGGSQRQGPQRACHVQGTCEEPHVPRLWVQHPLWLRHCDSSCGGLAWVTWELSSRTACGYSRPWGAPFTLEGAELRDQWDAAGVRVCDF